jgi:excisionase family DNA binding protein
MLEAFLKEFLTINELSEYLNLKRSTLYSLVENGELLHYRIGRLIRFRKQDIDAWMENHRREGINVDRKVKGILQAVKSPVDINSVVKKTVAEVKGNRYTSSHRETRPSKGLRKGVSDGAL